MVRHRIRTVGAVLGASCIILTSVSPGGARAARDPLALIDSLLAANRSDSVLALSPAVLDEALERGDSLRYGRVLAAQGRAQLAGGMYADGLASLDRSLEVARSIGDTLGMMNALGFKGFALAWQGRYDDCLRLNEEKLALALASGDLSSEGWARTAMGYVHLQQGRLDEARAEYTAAVDLFRAAGMTQAELTPLIGLGRVYNTLQDVDSARDCYRLALTAAREVGDRAQESHAVNNLGTLEYVYGDMALAEQYFARAYELAREMGSPRAAVTPASNIAMARTYLGNYEEAAEILSAAIRICEEQGFRDLLGSVTNKLGEVRLTQRRPGAAARLYRRSLALGDALSEKQRHDAVLGLAEALADVDSTAASVELLRRSFETARVPERRASTGLFLSKYLRREGRPEEALAVLAGARGEFESTGSTNRRLFTAFELSAAHRAAGMPAEAYEWFERGMDLLDERRRTTDEYRWREVNTGTWRLLDQCRIILEYPPERPERERVEALFDIFQRIKARTLHERISEPRGRAGPPSDLAQLPPLTLRELREDVLEPGELFIDAVVGNNETFLFAVTADSCRLVSLPGRGSPFAGKAALYAGSLGARPGETHADCELADLDAMHRAMGDSILGDIADLISGSSRIIVALDQFLGSIPFGVLAPSGAAGAEGPICLSREVHRVPSAAVLRWLRAKRTGGGAGGRPPRILVLPPPDGSVLRGARREVEFLKDRFTGVDLAGEGKEAFLAGAKTHDVIHVATHIEVDPEKSWHSGILIGGADTAAAGALEGNAIVTAGSLRNGGALRADSETFSPDPYIRAAEIADARVPAGLVVLSGCESARGRVLVGEGVLGLTAAFIGAGAGAVVATLWPVDDAVTTGLMKDFYGGLARGLPAAAALREAQLGVRDRAKTRHPFYWAGFVVTGDGAATVLLEERRSSPVPSYALIILALLALGAFVRFPSGIGRVKKSNGRV